MRIETRNNTFEILEKLKEITCLSIFKGTQIDSYLLGIGHKNGKIQVLEIMKTEESWAAKNIVAHDSHSDYVKDISFIDKNTIVSGCSDGNLCIINFEEKHVKESKYLKLELKCKGMETDGIIREYERNILEGYRQKQTSEIF